MNKDYLPVYYHSVGYADEFHESEQYRASHRLNLKCRDAIREAIGKHYANNRLDEAAAREVIEQFGFERTMVVLSNTVIKKDWDKRFSPDNREWAHSILAPCEMLGERGVRFMVDGVHPGLVDLFITQVRCEYERTVGQRQSVKSALKDNSAQTKSEPKSQKKKEQTL